MAAEKVPGAPATRTRRASAGPRHSQGADRPRRGVGGVAGPKPWVPPPRALAPEAAPKQDAPLVLTPPSFAPPTGPGGDDPGPVGAEATPYPGPAFTQ